MSERQDEAIGLLAGLLCAHYATAVRKAGWTPGWEDDAERILEALEVIPASRLQVAEEGKTRAERLVARYRRPIPDGGHTWQERAAVLKVKLVDTETRLQEATEALQSLRAAWNEHMKTCQQHVNVPTFEEIDAWRNAPSNTASAELTAPPTAIPWKTVERVAAGLCRQRGWSWKDQGNDVRVALTRAAISTLEDAFGEIRLAPDPSSTEPVTEEGNADGDRR